MEKNIESGYFSSDFRRDWFSFFFFLPSINGERSIEIFISYSEAKICSRISRFPFFRDE